MSDLQRARRVLSGRVADTLLGAKESWTRRMFELATKLRADGGGPVHDLSLGNPSLDPPPRFFTALRSLLEDETSGRHRYMTNAGFPDVREFVAQAEGERFGLPITASDVTMTVGAAGGLNVVLRATVDPGDEILVPVPYFTEYDHYAANVGATLVHVRSRPDFSLDVDAIVDAIGERTRVLLLDSPNNPSGFVYSDAELDALARALTAVSAERGHPVLVVEDAPYRDLVHDGSRTPSMMTRYDDTLHLTSHSKDLGLAGERIGYIVVSPRATGRDVLSRAFSFCTRILGFVNAPALMQRMLPLVLGRPDGRVDVEVYARRCRRMTAALRELGFVLPDPKAGFFLFPRLPAAMQDESGGDIALNDRLIAERTIVVPGTAFGAPGHLRLSMAVDDATIDGAIAAFSRICSYSGPPGPND